MGFIRPAERSSAKPLIGIYAESGCGKTYSSLVLARGFVGENGRICMIETESGRGESYASPNEYPEIGGYDVYPLRDSFSPQEYNNAITAIEKEKYDAMIIDSASHEWEGFGGVLDMASRNQENGKKGPIVWQKPKMDHAKLFMLKITQTSIPLVILNMRAKYPMQEIVKNGKKEWVRAESLEPKQSEDILYEMFVHGWIDKNHNFNRTKCTSVSLEKVFISGAPLSAESGRALAVWTKGIALKERTEEEKMKNLAFQIKNCIDSTSDAQDLFDYWNIDALDDLKKIKDYSETAYNFLFDICSKKMEFFKQDGESA